MQFHLHANNSEQGPAALSCPLWVKSRHVQRTSQCPVYRRKQTSWGLPSPTTNQHNSVTFRVPATESLLSALICIPDRTCTIVAMQTRAKTQWRNLKRSGLRAFRFRAWNQIGRKRVYFIHRHSPPTPVEHRLYTCMHYGPTTCSGGPFFSAQPGNKIYRVGVRIWALH